MVASIATTKDMTDRQPNIILTCLDALHGSETLLLDLVSSIALPIVESWGPPLSRKVGVDMVAEELQVDRHFCFSI